MGKVAAEYLEECGMKPQERIQTLSTLLAAEIRDYIRSGKREWRKLPWLAMHTDGLNAGFKPPYSSALRGLWPLRTAAMKINGCYQICVDCETAEVVTFERKPVSDAEVLELSRTMEQVDVLAIIKKLKRDITSFERRLGATERKRADEHRKYLKGMFRISPTYKYDPWPHVLH